LFANANGVGGRTLYSRSRWHLGFSVIVMSSCSPPLMTHLDVQRLTSLLGTRVGLAYREDARRLRSELRRATVIASHTAPSDLVTMNSTVVYADGEGIPREVTVVYPWRAHERGVVSVLTPIGVLLLGRRVGAPWNDESNRLRLLELRYQPEAAGDFHL
jgi:regulator of nucleoside diphosphate kinase